MNNISMNQALGIWSELWQAYYGENGYGSDTAEIYAYRLMAYEPAIAAGNVGDGSFKDTEMFKVNSRVAYIQAAHSLYNLLSKFESDNECRIEVDGKNIRDWVETEIFDHRCHVRVIHKETKQKAEFPNKPIMPRKNAEFNKG